MSKQSLYTLAASGCMAGYVWLVYAWTLKGTSLSACLFKRIYHIPCPACGSTRAVMEIFHGHLKEAFMLNPNGFLIISILTVLPIWLVYDAFFKQDSFYRIYIKAEEWLSQKKVFVWLSGMVILNWAWTIYKDI